MSNNPLINTLRTRVPGETFRLPSGGLFYSNGELADDVKNGEVHVYPMTTVDEITLKSPDKLLSGDSVLEVIKRCVPQVHKPECLLSKDVDYLMICLRLMSYGETVEVNYQHNCKEAKMHTYQSELRPFVKTAKPIDPTTKDIAFKVITPGQQVVLLRPPLFTNTMQLYNVNFQAAKEMISLEEMEMRLLDIISDTIVQVDDVHDLSLIREWIRALPPSHMEAMQKSLHHVSDWGPSVVIRTTCKDCGELIEIDVPLNPVAFFS